MNVTNFSDINNAFMSSSQIIWHNIVDFLPTLILAIIVLVIGLLIASMLGSLITKITKGLKVDKLLNTVGLADKLKEADVKISLSGLFGWIVKWFIIIAVLLTVANMLSLDAVSDFLKEVLLYIPNVLVAVVILTIGLVVGNFTAELVEKSVRMSDFINNASIQTLKSITKWVIVLFAVMAALSQLGIAPQLIQIFFTGVVMMFALAGGLAFGLAGRDKAKEIIERMFR